MASIVELSQEELTLLFEKITLDQVSDLLADKFGYSRLACCGAETKTGSSCRNIPANGSARCSQHRGLEIRTEADFIFMKKEVKPVAVREAVRVIHLCQSETANGFCRNAVGEEGQRCHLHREGAVRPVREQVSVEAVKCAGLLKSGKPCNYKAKGGIAYCLLHVSQGLAE